MSAEARPERPSFEIEAARIRHSLTDTRFGRHLELLPETGSTMDLLAERARAGAPEGSVLLANLQTAGRGRLDRAWLAPPGSALMLSALFRPDPAAIPAQRIGQLGMAFGLAAHAALASRMPPAIMPALKWPNDLMASGDKLGGLLAEADWGPGRRDAPGPRWIVVGIGINLAQSEVELPAGATSLLRLWSERGLEPSPKLLDRAALAGDLLAEVDRLYTKLEAGESLLEAWSDRLETLGRQVVARASGGELRGLAESVDSAGGLVLRLADGRREVLRAGDVTLAPTAAASAGPRG